MHLKFDVTNYQDFTASFVRLCKICKHGGFLQSQSHILCVASYICVPYLLANVTAQLQILDYWTNHVAVLLR